MESLDYLAVPPEERPDLLASAPHSAADRAAVELAADRLVASIGPSDPANAARLTEPPAGYTAPVGYFGAHVCLALLDAARGNHAALGISEEVSRRSLGAFSNNLSRHRRIYGRGGLDGPEWVPRVFQGIVFHLGRLVFDRVRLGPALAAATGGAPHDPAIGVHIPPTGPLRRDECLDSFARAADFFPRYFPAEPAQVARCRSWLMDRQLARYLPAQSNLVRFHELFTPCDDPRPGDEAIVEWVFETAAPADWDALTPRTTLERAVLEHLRGGGHWQVALGWRPFR